MIEEQHKNILFRLADLHKRFPNASYSQLEKMCLQEINESKFNQILADLRISKQQFLVIKTLYDTIEEDKEILNKLK